MGAAYFYHLTQRPLVETLTMLLEKSLANGWRVALRGSDREGLQALDRALWTYSEDSFLPHGMAGGPQDADQPVLLTLEGGTPNRADCLMAVHGANVTAEEIASFQRVCVLFDGHDPMALDQARGLWKRLKSEGASAQYWSEESGRWEKKAET